MSTRNKLLESIVLALGGTVTNPNNRNQLLYDWLTAKGGVPPQTRYVYNFNGVNQYLEANIPVSTGDKVSFKLRVAPDDNNDYILCSSGSTAFAFYRNSGYIFGIIGISEIKIDGVVSYTIPTDNLYHDYELTVSVDESIALIGSRFSLERFLDGSLIDLKINDGSVYNYPINDRTFGAGAVIANTGTGPDATGVNLLESGWQEINL